MSQIQATLDAVKILDNARMTMYKDGDATNAVTSILYRAARRLDADARRMLTGE